MTFSITPLVSFRNIIIIPYPSLRGVQRRRNPEWRLFLFWIAASLTLLAMTGMAYAATSIPFTINTSEAVNVTGTPRIAVDVGGVTRYATYTSGTGTNALTFTYTMVAGDLDLDGVALASPIDLNGGAIKDLNGNDATLTFTPPNTSNVKVNYPSLGMDFVADADGRYTLNGTVYNDLTSFLTAAGGTFTRASTATYFDSTGTMQTAASGVPRFDYDPVTHAAKGILIEESRTNSLTNGSASGAIVGVPGTLPTTWTWGGLSYASVSAEITATGTINGIAYFDLHLYGSPTNSGGIVMYTGGATSTAATLGQTWTSSAYLIKSAGSLTNLTIELATFSRNSGGAYLSDTSTSISPTSTLSRYSNTGTITNASTAYVVPGFRFNIISGQAIDITLRIGGLQLEQGSFPTSYIPTTTATVTRAADDLSLSTAGWTSSGTETIFAQADSSVPHANWASIFSYNSAYSGMRYLLMGSNGTITTGYGGSNITTTTTANNNTSFKAGSSFTATNTYTAINGNVTSGSALPNSAHSTVGIGKGNTYYLGGHIQKIKYYPYGVTSTQLQLLTQ